MTEQQKRQSVAERLNPLADRFKVLLEMARRAPLDHADKAKARSLLKQLKESLKEAIRTSKGLQHPFDRLFYSEVSQSLSWIKVKTNPVPSRQWISDLSYAEVNIKHALSRCMADSES